MKLTQTEKTLAIAASKAGMSERTARKYINLGQLPSQSKEPRHWRTREDAFKDVWPQVEQLLEQDPSVEALTIFDYLCRIYEGRFNESQLRTLQRRVKVWRALQGDPKEVMFPQIHIAGEQCQSDFTYMRELGVTIARQPFDHMFYHFVLPYSNWETGCICFSESFESLSEGLQNGLWELGEAPKEHRTDSLSAAFKNLTSEEEKEWTDRYKGLLSHYGMTASHSNPGRSHENGDVEQSHHRFKRAVAQELILKGSRDFGTRQEYEEFLRRIVRRRNACRREKLQEELQVMRSLPQTRLEDYTRLRARVTCNSTVSVKKNVYSVNSQLMGETVDIRVYAEVVEVWYAGQMIHRLERLRGKGKHAINYRHIIHSLVAKPGAFQNYCYREDLFPRLMFRVAYDYLQEHYPKTADRQYVKILEMAANVSEERVSEILCQLVENGESITAECVRQRLSFAEPTVQARLIEIPAVELKAYDVLLEEVAL